MATAKTSTPRPYHHGQLRATLIAAAVAEVEAVGAAKLSMREIARRAGVSHAAPAHHFGDKAGIFTAIATDGFRLATQLLGPATRQADGFVQGGIAYVQFAVEHRGYFEVMFRPELYRSDDHELATARAEAFQVLHDSARDALGDASDEDVTALVVSGWSLAHGFATLWLHANLGATVGDDPDPQPAADLVSRGVVIMGQVTARQLAARAAAVSAEATRNAPRRATRARMPR